ncbi:Cation channel sperm-associated protein 2 [Triplophysa tibetana]|uniref:Cation channel sperm-associated protein 2 n=1 Tax=Triplophysa tibetana TaxID=1572043 RepID=A0A5A9MX72_9TELE|nr:Cation channel sperm-associated protein 2 [Triplophysa tibetana]
MGEEDNLVGFTFQRSSNIKPQQRITNRVFNRYAKYPLLNMLPRRILDNKDQRLDMVQQYMNRCILAIFTWEVLLKWLEDSRMFWNMWNMFDLAVTAMTALPEILPQTDGSRSHQWLKLFIMFRTLRFLKIILKYPQLRLILNVVFCIFRGIQFRYMLFGVLVGNYIFAAVGVHLFAKYTSSSIPGLLYQDDFKDVPNSFLTMFSIFTMDHITALFKDIYRVPELHYNACVLFIVGWYLFGAVTLSSFIVGLIMGSFQRLRAELISESYEVQVQKAAEMIKAGNVSGKQCPENEPNEEIAWDVFFKTMEYQDQATAIQWHEECLLNYLRLQERLQIDLDTETQLQDKAVQALLKLHEH